MSIRMATDLTRIEYVVTWEHDGGCRSRDFPKEPCPGHQESFANEPAGRVRMQRLTRRDSPNRHVRLIERTWTATDAELSEEGKQS